MGIFNNLHGSRQSNNARLSQPSSGISTPKYKRGAYDHRKAQRGQNAFGAGGREVRSDVDEASAFEGPDINDRLAAFKSRSRQVPQRTENERRPYGKPASTMRNFWESFKFAVKDGSASSGEKSFDKDS